MRTAYKTQGREILEIEPEMDPDLRVHFSSGAKHTREEIKHFILSSPTFSFRLIFFEIIWTKYCSIH